MFGLYPILDLEACEQRGLQPLAVAEVWLELQPAVIQLRAKRAAARRTLELLQQLVTLAQGTTTLIVANDRPDLALMAGCGAVHLGQEDLPLNELRKVAPQLRAGLSTHNLEQLRAALALAPWYVAYGPIYATQSKADTEGCVGLAGLRAASALAQAHAVPLVAIGGIDATRLPEVAALVQGVALISALLGQDLAETRARFQQLQQLYPTGR